MLDPFDKFRCSFPVPDFESAEDERRWVASLRGAQRLELLHCVQMWRWGEAVMNAPIDRSTLQTMTMEEFRTAKDAEDAAEERWRAEHGLPPRHRHGVGLTASSNSCSG
jgi:hypothetical protein